MPTSGTNPITLQKQVHSYCKVYSYYRQVHSYCRDKSIPIGKSIPIISSLLLQRQVQPKSIPITKFAPIAETSPILLKRQVYSYYRQVHSICRDKSIPITKSTPITDKSIPTADKPISLPRTNPFQSISTAYKAISIPYVIIC